MSRRKIYYGVIRHEILESWIPGKIVISFKLGPDLTGLPLGSTFPILTVTQWKFLFIWLLFVLFPGNQGKNYQTDGIFGHLYWAS